MVKIQKKRTKNIYLLILFIFIAVILVLIFYLSVNRQKKIIKYDIDKYSNYLDNNLNEMIDSFKYDEYLDDYIELYGSVNSEKEALNYVSKRIKKDYGLLTELLQRPYTTFEYKDKYYVVLSARIRGCHNITFEHVLRKKDGALFGWIPQ